MKKIILILFCITFFGCQQKENKKKPYVIGITTFKYKTSVIANDFWKEDKNIQSKYTSKQPGYISRESGYSKENNEVLVMVKWQTNADANASMKKFMADKSVMDYVQMIDAPTMKMNRYNVE